MSPARCRAGASCPRAVQGVFTASLILSSETSVVTFIAREPPSSTTDTPYSSSSGPEATEQIILSEGLILQLLPTYTVVGCQANGSTQYLLRFELLSCNGFASSAAAPSGLEDCTTSAGCRLNTTVCQRSCAWDVLHGAEASFTVSALGALQQSSLRVYAASSGGATPGYDGGNGAADAFLSLQQLLDSACRSEQKASGANSTAGIVSTRIQQVFEVLAQQAHQRCGTEAMCLICACMGLCVHH